MLELRRLSFALKGRPLLRDLCLKAQPGELWAAVGPNGAGKSVLANLLTGEWKPSEGQVCWRDCPVNRYPLQALARERAALFQHPQMAQELTAEEVVLMGRYPHFGNQPRREDFEAVDRALALAWVEDMAGRDYHRLSGGERQRVQIARVLAQLGAPATAAELGGPRWLILDEPLNHLDVRYQHLLLDWLRRYAESGHLVWIVLHDLNLAARYAHRMLLLHRGEAMAQGGPAEVMRPELLGEVYGLPVEVDRQTLEARFFLPPADGRANNGSGPERARPSPSVSATT
jgi:iron complex transport system ATP-binding protein